MREEIVEILLRKLLSIESSSSEEYRKNRAKIGIGFCSIDDLLPVSYAKDIYLKFDPSNPAWRMMDSFREKKLTTKKFDEFSPLLKEITFAFQDPKIIAVVERITGIKNQLPDSMLYAGGLSIMNEGHFLGPHIDNSHDQSQQLYRRLNLLYYVTPGWKVENGGSLELWDDNVEEQTVIPSLFNRLVLMETHKRSWHSVSKVKVKDANRCCVSNYYFSKESPSDTKEDYFHVTSFMARPEEPFKRILCTVDNNLRALARVVRKDGFGKKDLYQKKAE